MTKVTMMQGKNWIPAFAGMTAMLGLTACEGIGDGNTLVAESLRVAPAGAPTQTAPFADGGTYKLFQCLRDELSLTGVFTDGTLVDYSGRATWTSSNPEVVRVSNGDVLIATASGGSFVDSAFNYLPGTVIPVGAVGQTATISATYLDITASIKVVIRKPELKIVPVPFPPDQNPLAYAGPAYLGPGTFQRFMILGNLEGRVAAGTALTAGGPNGTLLNPLLWKLSAGAFQPIDQDEATTFDNLWVAPSLAAPEVSIDFAGTVRGIAAGSGPHQIEAQLSLCRDSADAELRPVTTVAVAPFADTDPLTLGYEPGFHAPAAFAPPAQFGPRQQVIGTNQILQVLGHLDTDADGAGDVTQYFGSQVTYNFEPKDGLPNSLFSITRDALTAVPGTTGRLSDGFDPICLTSPSDPECVEASDPTPDTVSLEACFPICAPRLASLAAESPLTGPVVTLTATGVGIAGAQYIFDCGDGDGLISGASAAADCNYTDDAGPFTATVRILDSHGALAVNTGAVQISLDAAPADNDPPTASLTASPLSGAAPRLVNFSASASTDADAGDSVRIYEFHPDAGVVIRQSVSILTWAYQGPPAITPFVRVYDQFGVASTNTAEVALSFTGPTVPLLRSARLSLIAQPATACALQLVPPATTTEQAFTFPGLAFTAVASFIETKTDGTQNCDTDPLIGTQDVTRLVAWITRPAADSEALSDLAVLLDDPSDFQRAGQVVYFRNPAEPTSVSVSANPNAELIQNLTAPAPATLTITPCPASTCPP